MAQATDLRTVELEGLIGDNCVPQWAQDVALAILEENPYHVSCWLETLERLCTNDG